MIERLERWNCNPEAPGLIPAQTAYLDLFTVVVPSSNPRPLL